MSANSLSLNQILKVQRAQKRQSAVSTGSFIFLYFLQLIMLASVFCGVKYRDCWLYLREFLAPHNQ